VGVGATGATVTAGSRLPVARNVPICPLAAGGSFFATSAYVSATDTAAVL
jgi:hypothetical protein